MERKRFFKYADCLLKHVPSKLPSQPNLLTFLMITFMLSIAALLNPALTVEFSFPNIEILANDTLAVIIWPPVTNLSVDCVSPSSNVFRVAFFSREIDPYKRETSIIYMQPRVRGRYDLLISFNSNTTWHGVIGVYTIDSDFYGRIGSPTVTSQGYFVVLKEIEVPNENNQTLGYVVRIMLQAYSRGPSSIFFIRFPEPVNMAIFILIGVAVAYLNTFFILDSYFRSKSEGISKIRWIMVGLLVAVSLYILYWLYTVMSGEAYV